MGECPASKDTCGTCGGKHCTNTCQNRERLWCITCESTDHTSWDRNCPEFNRCCYLMDERNLENGMLYFPTEQDWSQSVWLSRIPFNKQFPGRYTVNSLPIYGTRQPNSGPWETRGRGNAPPPRNTPKWGNRPTDQGERSFPNSIPINKDSRQPVGRPDGGTADNHTKQPG